ncbi:TPA: hypothetical protein DDX46_04635 [Candidatus Saccharibacteria bacterium]|nr:MAG: hypothetical protein UW38_C0001G1089 [Candidatus Saccharibacteria bacterium GW2011_GWC2_44_17]OGL34193.1 MAG: hypothetical protein A3E20_04800 [Candidatus Saccharibacteria bacterium RIFCSPHIGHO2_12_FULL_47_16]HBH78002.1 hypothetical protein [Candidatus Saccharibacteria bacterium]
MALSVVGIRGQKVRAKEHLLASGRFVWSAFFIVLVAFMLIIAPEILASAAIFIATVSAVVLLVLMACGGWLRH